MPSLRALPLSLRPLHPIPTGFCPIPTGLFTGIDPLPTTLWASPNEKNQALTTTRYGMFYWPVPKSSQNRLTGLVDFLFFFGEAVKLLSEGRSFHL